ncbi:UDP-2,4-diacetamido-2,4,6-trideoxy-beta-L-altropyranose hydrolase [Pelomonas cellulosilytica]|uniref:UDP-2,4-diacetamido-2,4, 6-trideoxy-beta-L-altropyranose hydrolase n=1 Tax=Pelomonas cellulosilytica TaxID=2906762 RepID=A0ABS8XXV6_9BURK|nr:UDP-2,4-diacetamido-2,4,6-trideoxy-beta-L-altropyranose hydrolase [Pelomonas sp. P8]MCE4556113.1 UDP-2,4-diacetamido-2,4,6-trideoxy-beta-L-altropyranose hydrolase [Pelomonas sp. P8]
MHVAFRCDASSRIGLGHVLRSLSLAQALAAAGATTSFLLRDSDVEAAARVRAAGFTAVRLPLPPVHEPGQLTDADADARASISALNGAPPAWVVADHYGLDARWHDALRDALHCRLAVIDDLADRPLAADALIDHNLLPSGTHRERYAAVLRLEPSRWLCGPRHALLGPAYADLPAFDVREAVQRVGIFMGGTDPRAASATVLAGCRAAGFEGHIDIVTTSAAPSLAALQAAVAADGRATLTLDLPDLAGFYARQDLLVGAGGGGAWERCAVGVPSLTLCVADNQRAVIPALVAQGATVGANDLTPAGVATALRPLLADAGLRRRLSASAAALVDGWGARRVALALLSQAGCLPTLRAATMADAEALWRWRNHAATRAVSRQQGEIPLASHRQWLQRLLDAGRNRLSIASIGALDVGVIRFDPLDAQPTAAWEVSLYLLPQLHGLGLGGLLLRAGELALREAEGPLQVHAEVLAGNTASKRLFEAGGYRPQRDGHWIKPLG